MTLLSPDLKDSLDASRLLVEGKLRDLMRVAPGDAPLKLVESMRYSLFAGGKRLRPFLVLSAAECCGLRDRKTAAAAAAAFEMIHTYSLIHDDLPAMDDDSMRRGKPTNHKVYGEAVAILAGDALLTYAFEALAQSARDCALKGPEALDLISVASRAAGFLGMVGGQAADLEAEGWQDKNHGFKPKRSLRFIHTRKTAALIGAAVECGAILARAPAARRMSLRRYADAIGLAFQIADDVLDVTGSAKTLGKRGSDRDNRKLTYAALYGVDNSRRKAAELVRTAHRALQPFGRHARMLHEIADYILERDR